LNLGARKPRGIDIDWFNPYGDQVTHFIICTKSLNAPNSYNCQKKKKKNTSKAKLVMCISLPTKEKHK
jgi:hypothetical protein